MLSRFGLVTILFGLAALCEVGTAASDAQTSQVLVTVNGQPITEGDLEFQMLSHRVPQELRAKLRRRFLEQLVEKRLLQSFLADRKAKPNERILEDQTNVLLDLIRSKGDDPDKVLARLGYTTETLRTELSLPLAWSSYVRLTVTSDQLRDYWQQHRHEFDGTQVRASHIILKAKSPDELATAQGKLQQIRADILDGVVSFEDAAKRHSQSPSASTGGDLGYFPFRGKMAIEFSQAAFPLKVGELSQPFRTPFGMHLLKVTDRKPGQLNLEDVREDVLDQMGEEIRHDLIEQERAKARIEWKTKS